MKMNRGRRKGGTDLVVGLDCSTTGVKAVAFDKSGRIAACGSESIPLLSPRPNWYEQDPLDWWRSSQTALRRIARQVDPQRIKALAVSNQRETFVALDKKGRNLRPAIVWLDERCKGEVELFSRRIGKERIHRITGKPPDYAPVVYRLAWMKRNEPDLFGRIGTICDVQAYLLWKLTGLFNTSWASADPFGLFDLRNKKWSSVILGALGLAEYQFPEAFCPGTILGRVSEEASRKTGLSTNTLIVAGGGDGQAAGLGSNVLTSRRAYLNLGTAVVAGIYAVKYKTSKAFRTMSSCSEKGYYYESSLRAGTFAMDWLIREVLKIDPVRKPEIYRQLEREAKRVAVGSDGLFHLPYLCGAMNPYWDMDARGAFVGLSSSHDRGHMYRSILEGIAFEQSLTIHSIEMVTGTRVADLVAIGGGASNNLWCHILADTTGKNICIPENTEASALGAAIAAAVGVGFYATFREAAGKMARIKNIIKPDARNREKLKQLSTHYKKLYPLISRS
jgi:sugar (pentulose or hexulose) kinase